MQVHLLDEVLPEVHEVVLRGAPALRLQPGEDARGGVPAAQVHLGDRGHLHTPEAPVLNSANNKFLTLCEVHGAIT